MRTDNTYLKVILALSLIGILVSGWLLSVHIKFSTGQAGLTESCSIPLIGTPSQGCASVAVSDYSDVAGVPLAAIAMAFYFTLLILVFWAMRNYQMAYEALYVSFFLSTISILVTVVMFCISRFVLKSFCIGCAGLWLVNLALWPCFVKHLGLRWGNALGANLELLRHRSLNLKKERIGLSFALGAVCMLVFSVVGAAAKGLSSGEGPPSSTFITDYQNAPRVFLPPEAVGGASAKGSATPVMEIVEFADFQCPGCRMASQFLRPFALKHADKVRITFRHFPLDGSCNSFVPNGAHAYACSAARATVCAGAQGKFWEMHDLIFDNQDILSLDLIGKLVAKAGLDQAQYDACLKDSSTQNQLQRDIQWGDLIQLESTPTLIINGRRLVGAQNPKDLEALLQFLEREKK